MVMEYQLSNREKSLEPRGRHHWCDCCDASLVSAGAKCSVCGARSGKKRRSKAGKSTPR